MTGFVLEPILWCLAIIFLCYRLNREYRRAEKATRLYRQVLEDLSRYQTKVADQYDVLDYIYGWRDPILWAEMLRDKTTPPWPLRHHLKNMGGEFSKSLTPFITHSKNGRSIIDLGSHSVFIDDIKTIAKVSPLDGCGPYHGETKITLYSGEKLRSVFSRNEIIEAISKNSGYTLPVVTDFFNSVADKLGDVPILAALHGRTEEELRQEITETVKENLIAMSRVLSARYGQKYPGYPALPVWPYQSPADLPGFSHMLDCITISALIRHVLEAEHNESGNKQKVL
jgi:hypothetical protein